jgi:ABC-type transport system involved in cytochrome c biogenesis permease subunit
MLKQILKPLASLRLTVPLLAAAMFLVFAGTMAQVTMSNNDAQDRYFHNKNLLVWTPASTLLNRPLAHDFSVPFPTGYFLGGMLLINLLAAHSVRFKLTWKRSGIILTHLGLILLLLGEGLSSKFSVENRLVVEEGSSVKYTFDLRQVELAIVDPSPADHDNVTVIPQSQLVKGGVIVLPGLPFKVRVEDFYPNTAIVPHDATNGAPTVTAGVAAKINLAARALPRSTGVGDEASKIDLASVYATVLVDDKPIGTFLSAQNQLDDQFAPVDEPQEFAVNGKQYTLQLRFKRNYKPYTVTLKKFSFDRYTGTQMAKNFSSDIHFVDPSTNEDRMVHIWMNHPLRYQGETFFQAGWDENTEHGTVLQVVKNPGWLLPYISCAIGGIGLLIHFGITLINFLSRRADARKPKPAVVSTQPGKKGKPIVDRPPISTLGWADWGVPGAVAFITLIYVISQLFPPKQSGDFDLRSFSQLPVSRDGRVQPLDTTARVALRSLRGKDHITVEEKDEKGEKQTREMPAAEWLADVIARPDKAANYQCFRIDWPELVGRISKEPGAKYFSPNEVFAHWTEFAPQIIKASQANKEKSETPYQQKLLELSRKVQLYLQLGGAQAAATYRAISIPTAELRNIFELPKDQTLFSLNDLDRSPMFQRLEENVGAVLRKPGERSEAEQQMLELLLPAILFRNVSQSDSLLLIPPQSKETDWQSLEASAETAAKAGAPRPIEIASYLTIERAYASDEPRSFNQEVDAMHARFDQLLPVQAATARFETQFNAFDPFGKCMALYVAAFVLVCFSWLGWSTPLYRSACALLLVALFVHTGGLIARIYISGRPPVTNLASSAIFIAWGVVVLSLGLEYIYRNTMGFVTAAVAGFTSLLIAERLSIVDGDTMKVLVAVLDTNFWLATHVVCVTLGYASTFLAGLLGIIYIVWGLLTTSMTKERSRELGRMIYGIVCFAMFFSFVGTILGGIWADQSWGRFWGWDSKENGAVLVVLTNALLLHARWGGLVRERGIAVLAVFGTIITAWSWFGTNQLGIGLHSYGFTEGVALAIWTFVGAMTVVIFAGLMPWDLWRSSVNYEK